MLIRAMAPQVLAVDELGSEEDIQALRMASGCGCKLVATVHGETLKEIENKNYMRNIIENRLFDRYLVLTKRNGCCETEGIYDKEGIRCSNERELYVFLQGAQDGASARSEKNNTG